MKTPRVAAVDGKEHDIEGPARQAGLEPFPPHTVTGVIDGPAAALQDVPQVRVEAARGPVEELVRSFHGMDREAADSLRLLVVHRHEAVGGHAE